MRNINVWSEKLIFGDCENPECVTRYFPEDKKNERTRQSFEVQLMTMDPSAIYCIFCSHSVCRVITKKTKESIFSHLLRRDPSKGNDHSHLSLREQMMTAHFGLAFFRFSLFFFEFRHHHCPHHDSNGTAD